MGRIRYYISAQHVHNRLMTRQPYAGRYSEVDGIELDSFAFYARLLSISLRPFLLQALQLDSC